MLPMHREQVLKVAQDAFGKLGWMAMLVQMHDDFLLAGNVTLAFANMALRHFKLRFG